MADWIGIVVTVIATVSITALGVIISSFATKRYLTKVETEKARSARKEIESTLSRAIIQQGLKPSMIEIQRIINSKSREYGLSPEQVARAEEIVEDIYTKTVETDFIVSRWKKRIIATLNKILAAEKLKINKKESMIIRELQLQRRRFVRRLVVTIWSIGYAIFLIIYMLTRGIG